MTLEEATTLGKIVGTADNGCDTCVRELLDKLNAKFPDFVWTPSREAADLSAEFDGPHTEGVVVAVKARP